jgi:eukaryotic-like serine/threonine-protein kinase
MSAPAPLGVVAHYNLLERLEPAGPGELYRARDTRLGRTVAIRLLPPGFTSDAAVLIEKARKVIALSHPNVTTLFDVGEEEGRIYIAFEFLNGQSLRAVMAGRQMNVRRALEIAIQMADAVADAHASGYMHGGLSPDSVVITARGHAKIPAFELAARGGFEQTDGTGRLQDYVAPEEALGHNADDRADIFSVGAILYEMLTGRRPLHRGAAAPSASNVHVLTALDDVVLKAVAPNPDLRYQSVAAFAAELRSVAARFDTRGGGGDEDEPPPVRATNVLRVLIMAAVTLVIAAVILWALQRS